MADVVNNDLVAADFVEDQIGEIHDREAEDFGPISRRSDFRRMNERIDDLFDPIDDPIRCRGTLTGNIGKYAINVSDRPPGVANPHLRR